MSTFRRLLFLLITFWIIQLQTKAQNAPSLRLTNTFNEQNILYNTDSILHTAWKPIVYTDTGITKGTGSWFRRKFFQEHLLQVNRPDFNINADLIFDEYIGHSKRFVETPMMNTRGYEVSGNVGKNFYFETAFYENQGRFGGYIDSFIRLRKVIPGQGAFKNVGDGKGFDFAASNGRLIYMPGKHFVFDLGYGKNFIGDGYRSLLLSDNSYNYPYFKTTLNYGKFQYNVMWGQYISDRASGYGNRGGFFRKWAQTFLVDWKATKRLSIGVFETVIWPDQDSARNKDISPWLTSPIIFVHGTESPSGVKNNVMGGINFKYRLLNNTYLYGQFALDNTGKSWRTRYAAQGGIRAGNLFGIENLNGLLEANLARPYTYATQSLNTNFAHNSQEMAHPLGANFKEGLMIAEYAWKRWRFRLESFVAQYGGDSTADVNYGHNIFKSTDTHTVTNDAKIGQGLSTNIYFVDTKVSFVLNPSTNMRLETGFTFRNEKNDIVTYKDGIVYIGIRMSFRKIYYDF